MSRCRVTGKVRHRCRRHAKVAKERKAEDGVILKEYFCKFCKGWHLGGTPATRVATMDNVFDAMHARERELREKNCDC